jgi:hypothetical protein
MLTVDHLGKSQSERMHKLIYERTNRFHLERGIQTERLVKPKYLNFQFSSCPASEVEPGILLRILQWARAC